MWPYQSSMKYFLSELLRLGKLTCSVLVSFLVRIWNRGQVNTGMVDLPDNVEAPIVRHIMNII